MTHADGSDPSFEALVRPEIGRLYKLAYRLTGHVRDAEDLVQDVLTKAFQRRRELSSIDGLGAWLARVMYNQFIDDTRRHARRRFRVVSIDEGSQGSDLDAALASDAADPARAQIQRSIQRALTDALAALSIEHRTVVLMHDAEGYTLEEIQRITGVPLGTLKSRLHRARARLRELLDEGTIWAARSLSE